MRGPRVGTLGDPAGRRGRRLVAGVGVATALWTTPDAAGAQPSASSHAVLAGVVRAEDDTPISGARVLVRAPAPGTGAAPGAHAAVTADAGAFRVDGLTPGWAEVVVQRLGFRPETLTVEVPQPDASRIVVPLRRVSQVLATVVVRATAPRGLLAGFEQRRAAGFGRFVTRADIERRRPQRTTDVLRNVPGLVIERGETGTPMPRFRNAVVGLTGAVCDPVFVLDGSPLGPSLDLDALNPASIEGIELYSGIATVPPALRGARVPGTCGVVAVWTRHGEAPVPHTAPAMTADSLDALVTAGRAFTADQVDVPALPLPGAVPVPAYPDALRAAHTAGRVVAEFVVDELGRPDETTFGVVSATHPDFADAVAAVLPTARFSPAARRGRAVRQVVHLPVLFDPELGPHVVAPTARPGAPTVPR